MGILEQLEQQGFLVLDGKRRLLAQLDLGRTVFAKGIDGHVYRITAPGRVVSIEVIDDVDQNLVQTILLQPVRK
ncbi:hypothetical protein [Pseudomonas hunanensis]|uniref:hypothetical protein n=1 Tax=Pseudomonas hunanensis TaxID=1247546 RepID=UPI0030DBDC03